MSTVRISVLSCEGDRVLTCEPTDTEALALVQFEFDKLLGSGYAAFVIEQEGGAAKPTRTIVAGAFEHVAFRQGYGG